MNKIISFFVLLLLFSCISYQKSLDKNNNPTLYFEGYPHLIVFSFDKKVESVNRNEILHFENKYIFKGETQVDMIPASKYHFTFVSNKKDTMEIKSILGFSYNYYFSNMKFKKGNYKLVFDTYYRDDILIKKGKKIFSNSETFLNTEIVHYSRSYKNTKTLLDTIYNDTIRLKDIDFEYYDYKQKDFTLIKED